MDLWAIYQLGSRDSLLVRAPDSWSKGFGFESRQQRQENFLLQSQLCVPILIRCLFHPRVIAVERKRPLSFFQKRRWQVTPKHAYTLDPSKSELADYAAVQAECGNQSGNELTRNSSGNTLLQSSQLSEPLWTDPGLKSGISVYLHQPSLWMGRPTSNWTPWVASVLTAGEMCGHTITTHINALSLWDMWTHYHQSHQRSQQVRRVDALSSVTSALTAGETCGHSVIIRNDGLL